MKLIMSIASSYLFIIITDRSFKRNTCFWICNESIYVRIASKSDKVRATHNDNKCNEKVFAVVIKLTCLPEQKR